MKLFEGDEVDVYSQINSILKLLDNSNMDS